MRLLIVFALSFTAALQVSVAEGRVTRRDIQVEIHFDTAADHLPDYLCVILSGKPKIPWIPVKKATGKERDLPLEVLTDTDLPENVTSRRIVISTVSLKNRDSLFVETARDAARDIDTAVMLLNGIPPKRSELLFNGLCEPKMDSFSGYKTEQSDAYMTCVKSSTNVNDGHERVAVIEVHAYKSELGELQFDGEKATLNFPDSTIQDYFQVTARVLGGHYESGNDRLRMNGRIDLSLSPRCYSRRLELPRRFAKDDAGTELTYTFGHNNDNTEELPTSWNRDGIVLLPRQESGDRANLELKVSEQGKSREATYVTTWQTSSPPNIVRFNPAEVWFEWRVSPNYPLLPLVFESEACPAASIPVVGLSCEGYYTADNTEYGTCYYNCRSSNNTLKGFEYPQTVRFIVESLEDTWEETLAEVGQTFDSYTSPASRHTIVVFSDSDWFSNKCNGTKNCETSRVNAYGDRINTVKLMTSDGRVYRIPALPADSPHIVIPGAGDGDLISYCVEGDRAYACRDTHIQNGKILIMSPNDDAKIISLSLNVAGGFATPFTSSDGVLPAKPYVSAQIAMKFNPVFSPPLAFELHATYLLSKQMYRRIDTPNSANVDNLSATGYNRFLFSLNVVVLTNNPFRFAFSPGLGLGIGYPLMDADTDKVGSPYIFWVLTEAHLRYALNKSRTWLVEIDGRVLAFENLLSYESNDDIYISTPKRDRDRLFSIHVGVGLRGWLF